MMRRVMPWVTAALIAGALVLVIRVLHQFSLPQVIESLQRLNGRGLAFGLLFTAGSYLSLTAFDYLGLRYAGHRLPYRQVALASFVSLSIGHTLGLAPLSSGAIRYRFYSRLGLDALAVAKVIVFSGVTVALGELSLAAAAALFDAELAGRIIGIDQDAARLLGVGCVALLALYMALSIVARPALSVGRLRFAWPSWRLAIAQIAAGCVNYMMVAAALEHTIAPAGELDYFTVAAAYILANLAALASHVPGGLGVIEAVIVTVLPGAQVIGGLVAFRVIYFLIPFTFGTLLFIAVEARAWLRRRRAARVRSRPATDLAG